MDKLFAGIIVSILGAVGCSWYFELSLVQFFISFLGFVTLSTPTVAYISYLRHLRLLRGRS